jgi:SAM-dependent methyltransferase
MEKQDATEHRRELLTGLAGGVVEVGAGNGLNFAHYPSEVTEVVAYEPEPYLRARALEAAACAPVPVRVEPGLADALPAADGEFDAAVCSLVLCSVRDLPGGALAEVGRVVRSGGELRFYEHVRGDGFRGHLQDAVTPFWKRMGRGCHANRDTFGAIEEAGFAVEHVRRFEFLGWLVKPQVIGAARRH